MIHVASYGMTEKDFGGSRLLILMLLTVSALAYGFALKRTSARLADEAVLRTYTPLAPYFVSLVACLLCMIALAGTFNNLGPITGGDRFLAFFLPTIATGMLLVIQLHRQNPPSSPPSPVRGHNPPLAFQQARQAPAIAGQKRKALAISKLFRPPQMALRVHLILSTQSQALDRMNPH